MSLVLHETAYAPHGDDGDPIDALAVLIMIVGFVWFLYGISKLRW